MKTASVKVALKQNPYSAHIGAKVIDRLGSYLKSVSSKRAFLVADRRLADHQSRAAQALKNSGWQVHEMSVEAGERLKEFSGITPIYAEMLKAKIDRSSTLIALGGGSVGDAAGFVASTYMRGISWVGLPTTLMSQVDSAIGGKTAVNLPEGKNLVGTFHQPSIVLCETDFLKTLSQREMVSGLGEVIKYGLCFDPKFFEFTKANWQLALAHDPKVLTEIVKVSLSCKAKAVAKDPFDTKGVREVLNFGHTFGHALEAVTNYQAFQHGEAIVWGMRFACGLSHVRRKLSNKNWESIDRFLASVPVPPLPKAAPEQYLKHMSKDKKSLNGQVRFVLLKKNGETWIDRNVTQDQILLTLDRLSNSPRGL